MGGNDQRENVALGICLAICVVLTGVALSGIQGSASIGPDLQDVSSAVDSSSTRVSTPETFATGDSDGSSNDLDDNGLNSVASGSEPCTLTGVPLGFGSFGDDIFCLQRTLKKIELFSNEPNGLYDDATFKSVLELQSLQNLHVDGIVGRKTGNVLGIWPLDPFTVERTPVPLPGAVDLWGMPLSTVATSGPDAPPLPPESGSGYRLVFDRAAQRVWAVDENEIVIRSWLVSGSREGNETPGTHKVYSRSKNSVSRDGESYFSYMVRWLRTRDDAIGFHSLPRRTLDDSSYQTEDELGIRLSSGCQRQADLDAQFTWRFATVGTPVVVL